MGRAEEQAAEMNSPTLDRRYGTPAIVIACGWYIGLTVALVLRLIYA